MFTLSCDLFREFLVHLNIKDITSLRLVCSEMKDAIFLSGDLRRRAIQIFKLKECTDGFDNADDLTLLKIIKCPRLIILYSTKQPFMFPVLDDICVDRINFYQDKLRDEKDFYNMANFKLHMKYAFDRLLLKVIYSLPKSLIHDEVVDRLEDIMSCSVKTTRLLEILKFISVKENKYETFDASEYFKVFHYYSRERREEQVKLFYWLLQFPSILKCKEEDIAVILLVCYDNDILKERLDTVVKYTNKEYQIFFTKFISFHYAHKNSSILDCAKLVPMNFPKLPARLAKQFKGL